MKGLSISDKRVTASGGSFLSFDLKDILALLPEKARRSTWTAQHVECTGSEAAKLHEISDSKRDIEADEFFSIANGIFQTIDGVFTARIGDAPPWITIEAVDSSAFDVLTEDDEVLERLRQAFRSVQELDP